MTPKRDSTAAFSEGIWFCENCGSRIGTHRSGYSCWFIQHMLGPDAAFWIPREA